MRVSTLYYCRAMGLTVGIRFSTVSEQEQPLYVGNSVACKVGAASAAWTELLCAMGVRAVAVGQAEDFGVPV
jgi:hypothetical protein